MPISAVKLNSNELPTVRRLKPGVRRTKQMKLTARLQMSTTIDTTFDFRSDAGGKDPDRHSETLRAYHKQVWTKPLPSGELFRLEDDGARGYLRYRSSNGADFPLSSDAVIPTFKWASEIKKLIPATEVEAFNAVGYTMGGMMLFPSQPIGGKWTINQARGCTKRIGDRFDLTLECIRRHYCAGESPLTGVLARYARFFDLFRDFRGYVEFFLLQDIVSADFSAVKISKPFDNFNGSPIPSDASEYNVYKSASVAFVQARNRRILVSSDARGSATNGVTVAP